MTSREKRRLSGITLSTGTKVVEPAGDRWDEGKHRDRDGVENPSRNETNSSHTKSGLVRSTITLIVFSANPHFDSAQCSSATATFNSGFRITPSMRLTLERFLLMEPETSPHRPGESNSEQRQQLIELVRVTEMSKFTRSRRLGCSSQVSY